MFKIFERGDFRKLRYNLFQREQIYLKFYLKKSTDNVKRSASFYLDSYWIVSAAAAVMA